MAANTQRLHYKRLNSSKHEFRVLELQPAQNRNDPVQCRLVTVSLHDELEFLALSSLYGDATETEKIWVNGQPVVITQHLAQALKHVRTVFFPTLAHRRSQDVKKKQRAPRWLLHLLKHVGTILPDPDHESDTPLRLWVDVLCINQADEREKSNQIVGMNQIYKAAKMVIGWLGMKSENTDAGLAVFKEIDDAMPRHWGDELDKLEHPENYSPQHQWAERIQHIWQDQPDGTLAFTMPHWAGANDFMYRPYFQQGWILEEITMANYPAFLIGDSIVSWKLILRINRFMEEFKEHESDLFPAKLRAMIAFLPLGTIHALLDEFVKRRREEDVHALDSTRSSQRTESSQATKSTQLTQSTTNHINTRQAIGTRSLEHVGSSLGSLKPRTSYTKS